MELKGTYHKRCKSPRFGEMPPFHLVQNQFVRFYFSATAGCRAFPLKVLTVS